MANPLRLPSNAAATLDQAFHMNVDLGKWLVYGTHDVSKEEDIDAVCHTAMEIYSREHLHAPESEWCELGFLKPAVAIHQLVQDVQAALNRHLELLRNLLGNENEDQDVWNSKRVYPFGFMVVERKTWREEGVIVVHCDKNEDEVREGGRKAGVEGRVVLDLGERSGIGVDERGGYR